MPSHLYEKLPEHLLSDGTPDYLRMILMCEWAWRQCSQHDSSALESS